VSFFSNFFKLSGPIAGNANTLADDVINTKKALKSLGHFGGSINPWPSGAMLDGLKTFQKSTGLAMDGIMKPGGPTERGLNQALHKSGIGDKLFQGIVAKAPRDRANHRTGTPPYVAERKTAEPWFHSSKLPPIKGDALSSNERILTALLKTAANGDLPMYQADALKSGKASAIGEYADFLRQMHKRAPERVTGYEKDVMKRLPAEAKTKLATYLNQSSTAKPSPRSLLVGDAGNDNLSHTMATIQRRDRQSGKSDSQPIPEYRKQAGGLQGTHWTDWSSSVGKLENASAAETHAYKEIFAAEGGLATDPKGGAASGITQKTLDRAIKDGALPDFRQGGVPENLTIDQRARVYRHHFDDVLKTVDRSVPGSTNLQKIGDAKAATAFADTLFAHGSRGGTKLIQKAINKMAPDSVTVDGKMGPKTFAAYKELVRNPETRRALLGALGDTRWDQVKGKASSGGWRKRIDHFRP